MIDQTKVHSDLLVILNNAKEMLGMINDGFRKDSLKSLGKVEEIRENLSKDSDILLKLLFEGKSEEGIKQFIPIPGHLDRIGDGLDKLYSTVKVKIKEGILFSDKSVNETYKLFDETTVLLTCLSDCVSTGNKVLAEHINKEGKKLGELADEYAIFHEDRLIAGVCMPKNAPVYLDILGSFKDVVWHVREITRNILAG